MKHNECIRLYDKNGQHVLSLLPCCPFNDNGDYNIDLCLPDGTVIYCDFSDIVTGLSMIYTSWPKESIGSIPPQ